MTAVTQPKTCLTSCGVTVTWKTLGEGRANNGRWLDTGPATLFCKNTYILQKSNLKYKFEILIMKIAGLKPEKPEKPYAWRLILFG